MPKNLIITEAFGAHAKGDVITDSGLIATIEGSAQDVFGVLVATGLEFDGAASGSPTLSADKRTVTWPLGTGTLVAAIESAATLASGKYFAAVQVAVTGAFNVNAFIGFGGSGFNVANLSSLSGNTDLIGAGTSGTTNLAVGADTALLDSHELASGDVIITAVDITDGSWGGTTPTGATYVDLQAQVGVGGHALGMPAGALSLVGMVLGGTTSGSGSVALQLLTDAGLAALGKAGPAGYSNVAG